MKFSERIGIAKQNNVLQLNSMNDALKHSIWNVLTRNVWSNVESSTGIYPGKYISKNTNKHIYSLCTNLWEELYKIPIDQLDSNWEITYEFIRESYYKSEWYTIYEFIEFIGIKYRSLAFKPENYYNELNIVLEREASGYRFSKEKLIPVTNIEELAEIEKAQLSNDNGVKIHIARSIELFSDRLNPDYRNSIKEAISAVESKAASILGEKGTLGQLLKHLEKETGLHGSLKTAFGNLYGYTSDESGIRHAIMDSAIVDYEDALFFLIICSAFINYLEAKSKKVA